jgi:hypothetical protein
LLRSVEQYVQLLATETALKQAEMIANEITG